MTVESGNLQKIYFLYPPPLPNNLHIRIVYSDLKAYRVVWESREIRIVNSRCATCERTRVTRNVPRCRWRIGRVSSFSKIAGALLWNARSDAEKKWKDDAIGAGGFTKQVKKRGNLWSWRALFSEKWERDEGCLLEYFKEIILLLFHGKVNEREMCLQMTFSFFYYNHL